MDSYDITPEQVIDWAVNYAGYDDLETVAKAIYGHYVERRKRERPADAKKAKQRRVRVVYKVKKR